MLQSRLFMLPFLLFTAVSCSPAKMAGGDSTADRVKAETKKSGAGAEAETKAEPAAEKPVFTSASAPLSLACAPQRELRFLLSAGLNSENVYLLSRFAMLGSQPLPFAASTLEPWLKSAGFEEAKLLENPARGVQGVVARSASMNVVVFRGTHNLAGVMTNAKTTLESAALGPGTGGAHRGFVEAYESISAELAKVILSEKGKAVPTFFVGHSLGGALALLASLDHGKKGGQVGGLVTLGQPRTGNVSFVNSVGATLDGKLKRFVHANDPVPHLPPSASGAEAAVNALLSGDVNSPLSSLPGLSGSAVTLLFARASFSHVAKPEHLGQAAYASTAFDSDGAWDQRYWVSNRDAVRSAIASPSTALERSLIVDHMVEKYLCEILKRVE